MIGLQKPDIIEYFHQKKSGADTVDQMTGAHNVARDTRRWPPVTFYTTEYCRNKCSDCSYASQLGENKAQNIYWKSCNTLSVRTNKKAFRNLYRCA